MTAVLDTMLSAAALSIVFQPIFDISSDFPRLWAMEALTRGPMGTHFESASVLFDYVRLKRDELRVDRHCCQNALAAAARAGMQGLVTINAHASTLERDPSFPSFLVQTCASVGFPTSALIVEIVEHVPYIETSRLCTAVAELRGAGIRIAVDDLGFGHGNLRMFLDVRPHYVKIERYFVDGAAADKDRRALLRAIVGLAHDFGAGVIAEGVEREDDLHAVRAAGITLAQGFLLGRPAPTVQCETTTSPEDQKESTCNERRFSAWTTPQPSS